MKWAVAIAVVTTAIATQANATAAQETLSTAPMKMLLSSQIGWNVDETTGGQICTVASEDVCQPGKLSDEAGGFEYLSSVAVDSHTGNVYVADSGNSRVQELTAAGVFVAMFGWGVNETKDKHAAATQEERNVCTAVSRDICTAGVRGASAGQLTYPASVTVDPVTGDVYVAEVDVGYARVDRYAPDGHFVWMIGREVNATTKGNICTEREIERSGVKCKAGVESTGSPEPGAFKILANAGDELAAGGPEDLLYVGEEGRVQEFEPSGRWKREIAVVSPTPVSVAGIAVDQAGDVYVLTATPALGFLANVVHKLDQNGYQIAEFVMGARQPYSTVTLHGLAVDGAGRLAVIGGEEGLTESEEGRYTESYMLLGALYDADTGHRISEFTVPVGNDGLAFSNVDELYVAATDGREVLRYGPTPVASLVTSPLLCKNGSEDETSATFDCVPNANP